MVKKRTLQEKEPHWNELISVWFSFCREHYNTNPSFVNSAPRDLKLIVKALRLRAEKQGVEWSLNTSCQRLNRFLQIAHADKWLQNNWLLSNINRQRDRIFFTIQKSADQNQTQVNPFD